MSDAVLVLNAGSSSIKLGLFQISKGEPALLCKGLLDEQQAAPRLLLTDPSGKALHEECPPAGADEGHRLFAGIFDFIEAYFPNDRLAAVGHRIVHGGRDFSGPVAVTEEVLKALDGLTPLAPLHQPGCIAPIRAIMALRPGLVQIACFDTAFHHTLAPPVSRFAIPSRFEARGVRRYGFHGLSFEYVVSRLAALSPDLIQARTVVAHLGSGASLCAIAGGKSVDTTMGLTPLDGLVMGTRCGAIDPGVLLYLLQDQKMSPDAVQHLLYEKSGLLGVSGISADMRVLLASGKASARDAVDPFTFRVASEVAVMANTLKGLDCVVFTGGIGEHSSEIRARIGDRLAWLGLALDASANAQGLLKIAAADSRVDALIIPTSEETMIASHCAAALSATAQA